MNFSPKSTAPQSSESKTFLVSRAILRMVKGIFFFSSLDPEVNKNEYNDYLVALEKFPPGPYNYVCTGLDDCNESKFKQRHFFRAMALFRKKKVEKFHQNFTCKVLTSLLHC